MVSDYIKHSEGQLYPSITTVLKNRNKKGLHEWRERVGDDVVNYVSRKSACKRNSGSILL